MSIKMLPALLIATLLFSTPAWSQEPTRLTVLYDAFGKDASLQKDWGFSLLIEYHGKQILFDTGNNPEIFAHNIAASDVDLNQLDFAVISHRHGDHMGGLSHLIEVHPDLTIFAPEEGFGVFGATLPGDFYPSNPKLPAHMRYFDGESADSLAFGTAWSQGQFEKIQSTTTIAPGIHLIALSGSWGTDFELRELSLALETPDGIILIVGCSHPTIEEIVETVSSTLEKPILLVIGGTHLLPASEAEIQRIADKLHDEFNVAWLAPAHCTGEPAFEILQNVFDNKYLYAGLGSRIEVGSESDLRSVSPRRNNVTDNADFSIYHLLSKKEAVHQHTGLPFNEH